MSYLIDTDILIYSIKGNLTVNRRFAEKRNDPKSITVIPYDELFFGAKKSGRPEKNPARVRRIAELFLIIGISPVIMETYGQYRPNKT